MGEGESQILVRVDWSVVDANFIMEVRAGAASAQTNVADGIATMHVLPGCDREVGKVPVAGTDSVTVVDHDGAAIAAHEIRKNHYPISRSHYSLTIGRGDVYSTMKSAFTVE